MCNYLEHGLYGFTRIFIKVLIFTTEPNPCISEFWKFKYGKPVLINK